MKQGTSKVSSVQGAGDFQYKGEQYYRFDYELEDGTAGQANHKTTEPRFHVGVEVDYTLNPPKGDYPPKLVLQKAGYVPSKGQSSGKNWDKTQESIEKQCALKEAVHFVVGGGCNDVPEINELSYPKQVIAMAEYFYEQWLRK